MNSYSTKLVIIMYLSVSVASCKTDISKEVDYEITCENSQSSIECFDADSFRQNSNTNEDSDQTICEWDCGNYKGKKEIKVTLKFERNPDDNCWNLETKV